MFLKKGYTFYRVWIKNNLHTQQHYIKNNAQCSLHIGEIEVPHSHTIIYHENDYIYKVQFGSTKLLEK